jgi:sugar transferase (PEP-CTERM/EpsH1 system associated)
LKILYLTHTFPYPLNDGVRLHIYYLLKELCARHEVRLLCLNDVPVSPEERKAVERLGVKIEGIIEHSVPKSAWCRMKNTLFDPVPFLVRQFESPALRAALKDLIAAQTFDAVHADYLSTAIYRPELRGTPAVFFPHDAVSMLFARNVRSETNLFRKLYTWMQGRKIRAFESEWIPRFDATMVVSPVDREYLLKHCPGARISVSPNGVDTDYFSPRPAPEEEHSVLFRGVMNFLPNADAARAFYQDVFPLIRKEIPGAKFVVVGKDPPQDLRAAAAADPGLILTGYVDDLRDWTARASVVVCPMRIGSGIKNKILESMSMEKAVVATPMACAGIEDADDRVLAVAETPSALAEKTLHLLKNPQDRLALGRQARAFVVDRYTWRRNADDFERLYLSVSKKGKI